MKKWITVAAMLFMAMAVKAQDCDAIMLAYFNNNQTRMESYKVEAPYKFEAKCAYAQAAFYESDTVPAGADLFQISEVSNKFTGVSLPANYQVDFATLNYYGYTFRDFQLRYPTGDKVLCFQTPGSTHPYLVLRSITDMQYLSSEMMNSRNSNQ